MAWSKSIFMTLAVTLGGVLAFPTAQHDQILVHHTPMHDVVFIPDFMMGEMPSHHHAHHHSHHQRQQGLVQIDGLGLAQIHQQPEHHFEAIEHHFQPQQQHILLNPNHAVYVSTQDEFGNLRTFKISQNSPLLQQHLLTGQEIPAKQATSENEKKTEEKIVEEIVDIKNVTDIVKENSSDDKEQVEKMEEIKIEETPKETQIENPEAVEEKKEADNTEDLKETTEESVKENEKADDAEKLKDATEEEILKEKTDGKEEVVIVVPTNDEEIVILEDEKDVTDALIIDNHDLVIEINDDVDDKSKEVHSIAKRDVSAQSVETLDDIEKEDEASENVSEETETMKKDLSETVEDKVESSEEKLPKSQIGSVDSTNVQKIHHAISSSTENTDIAVSVKEVEIIKPLTPQPSSTVDVSGESVEETPMQSQEATEEPKSASEESKVPALSEEDVNESSVPVENTEDVVEPKITATSEEDTAESETPVTKDQEEVFESKMNATSAKDSVESNVPISSVEDVVESKESSSAEEKVKSAEEVDEKVVSEETEEILTPASEATPAPSSEDVAPLPQEVLSRTSPMPKLLSTESAEE